MSDMAFKFDYEREADRLSAENAALRTNYETACKLVADMHAAAMGAKVGPVVGVVEDVLRLRAEVEELRAENFALAAGQCVNATADEGGRPYCKELAALRAERAVLLTDEQIEALFLAVDSKDKGRFTVVRDFARAIERAHGIGEPK